MKAAGAVAALLLVGALAGCVGEGGAGITAKEAAARAGDRARQWHGDAALLHLGAWEAASSDTTDLVRRDIGVLPPIDPRVGDGRSLVWIAGFASESANRSLQLFVFANGTIIADEERMDHSPSIGTWELDSPGMADAVKRNADVAGILAAPDAAMASFLTIGSASNVSDPIWGFVAMSPSLQRVAQGAVGARRGDLLMVHVQNLTGPPFGGAPLPEPLQYEFSGTVDPGTPTAAHPFEVRQGHRLLAADLATEPNLPRLEDASLRILDPDGNELPGSAGGQDRYVVAEAGTYVAEVTYRGAVPPAPPVPGVQGVAYTLAIEVE